MAISRQVCLVLFVRIENPLGSVNELPGIGTLNVRDDDAHETKQTCISRKVTKHTKKRII